MDAKGQLEFSQGRGVFAVEGQFRSGVAFSQPISQLQNEGGLRNGTRVPRGCFATAKFFIEGGYGAAK